MRELESFEEYERVNNNSKLAREVIEDLVLHITAPVNENYYWEPVAYNQEGYTKRLTARGKIALAILQDAEKKIGKHENACEKFEEKLESLELLNGFDTDES